MHATPRLRERNRTGGIIVLEDEKSTPVVDVIRYSDDLEGADKLAALIVQAVNERERAKAVLQLASATLRAKDGPTALERDTALIAIRQLLADLEG